MKKWTIYCHKNKINNKRYIGQTSQDNLNNRWKNGQGYKPKIGDNNTKFYNAIQKYGWDNFQHIILEDNITSLDKANQRQQYWISYYNTFNNDNKGYNMTPGGNNHLLDDETKKKLRKTLIETYKNHPEKLLHIEKNKLKFQVNQFIVLKQIQPIFLQQRRLEKIKQMKLLLQDVF